MEYREDKWNLSEMRKHELTWKHRWIRVCKDCRDQQSDLKFETGNLNLRSFLASTLWFEFISTRLDGNWLRRWAEIVAFVQIEWRVILRVQSSFREALSLLLKVEHFILHIVSLEIYNKKRHQGFRKKQQVKIYFTRSSFDREVIPNIEYLLKIIQSRIYRSIPFSN